MSGIDGVELIRRIRATDSPARIILLSGFIGCLGMTEQSTGADELISKSNKEVPELLRAIRKLASEAAAAERPHRLKAATIAGRRARRLKAGHASVRLRLFWLLAVFPRLPAICETRGQEKPAAAPCCRRPTRPWRRVG